MRTVLHQLGRFKRDTFLCIGLCTLEVIMEILLPFITARARSFLSKAADLTDGRKSAWQRTVSLLMEIFWPEEESAWGNVFCFPIIETGSG